MQTKAFLKKQRNCWLAKWHTLIKVNTVSWSWSLIQLHVCVYTCFVYVMV